MMQYSSATAMLCAVGLASFLGTCLGVIVGAIVVGKLIIPPTPDPERDR